MRCIDKGDFWIVTGQTSTFKSSFTLTELVVPSVEWILERLEEGLDIKVFYFLLEENKQDLEIRIISYLFAREFGMQVSENALHGRGEKLTKDEKDKLLLLKPSFNELMTRIDVFDDLRHGYGKINLN